MNKWRAAGRGLAAGLLMAAAIGLAGCEETVGDENFDKIAVGMTLDQVQGFMGDGTLEESGGSTISSAGVLGSTNNSQSSKKTYTWKEGKKMIVVDVIEGKVVHKTKRGF